MKGLLAFVVSIVVSIVTLRADGLHTNIASRAVQSSAGSAVAPAFARNTGLSNPAARFLSIGGGQPVFITSNDVRIVDPRQRRSLWLTFVDGAARALDGAAPTGGRVTVLRANATRDVALYRDVVYRSIWPGVDVCISAGATGIKYSFEVRPGSDPRKIHLRYSGADRIALTAAGELRLDVGDATIVDSKPVASQRINGLDVPVEVRFVHRGTDVTFAVGKYDRSRDLVIDPTLVYSTYLGSSGMDIGRAIAVDSTGAAYVAGSSNYLDLPVTPGAYQTSWHGDPNTVIPDAFVAKIDPTGTHFDYVTYLGGFGRDEARGISVDAGGNAYVTGFTESGDFPTTAGAYRTTSSTRDGFLAKLNSTGTALVYSTFLGGNQSTFGNSVAVDNGGNAYVAGETQATNLPVSPGGVPYSHAPGSNHNFDSNGFLLKLNADGSDVLFGSYIGGNGPSAATGGAVTGAGTASVTGWTRSFDGIAGNTIGGTNGHSIQDSPNGPAYKSTDGALTFSGTNTRATATSAFVIDPTSPDTVYQGTVESGVLKTTDGGAHWTTASSTLGDTANIFDLAINPASPTTLLATGFSNTSGIWRTSDGGATWSQVSQSGGYLAFAPLTPSVVYATLSLTAPTGVLKSTDGGATWTRVYTAPQNVQVASLAVDPSNASIVYVGYNFGQILKTTDGGATWTTLSVPTSGAVVQAVAVDPSTGVVWAGDRGGQLYRSPDGGVSWTQVSTGASLHDIYRMTFDGGTLYATEGGLPFSDFGPVSYGIVKTTDGGATWSLITIRGSQFAVRGLAVLNGLVYAGGDNHEDAFLWRVDTNAGAQAFKFGTYLGGILADFGRGVTLDPLGNAVVAVETYSGDFPTTVAGAMTNGALARISPDGTALATSSYIGDPNAPTIPTAVAVDSNQAAYVSSSEAAFGETAVRVDQIDPSGIVSATIMLDGTHSNVGAANDFPNGIAAGPVAGDVFVTGRTASTDFPTTPGAPQPFYGSGSADAFIAKMSFGGSPPPPTNLALNKPVFVSSEFSAAYAGGFAVDGNPSTRWSSQFSDPQWIYVDLGQTYAIARVILRWETAFGADYQVQVSDDASHWTTILTITGGDGDVDDLPGMSGTGRYVRIYGTRRGTEWGYSLWEFEVYGAPAPPLLDVARNRPVVTSSDFSAQYAGPSAVDGDPSTRWSSEFSDPQWIYVDLGQRFQINRIKLSWETAYAADYQLQISNDAKNWATIATAQDNTQLTNDLGVGGIGRYVRMYGTRRGTEWGYSLWSFEVYGNPIIDNTDIALNRPATSSSDFSPQYAAALVVDGDPSTRWSSEFSDPQWIAVDLGQITVINEVRLTWETAYGADYEIQASYDGINWFSALTVTGATGGVDDLVVGGTGRYIRMYGTRRGTEWGYSLWSFEVYGHPTR